MYFLYLTSFLFGIFTVHDMVNTCRKYRNKQQKQSIREKNFKRLQLKMNVQEELLEYFDNKKKEKHDNKQKRHLLLRDIEIHHVKPTYKKVLKEFNTSLCVTKTKFSKVINELQEDIKEYPEEFLSNTRNELYL